MPLSSTRDLDSVMKQRGYNILADFSQLPIAYPLQVMATREGFFKTEPDLAERLIKAFVAGNAFTSRAKKQELG